MKALDRILLSRADEQVDENHDWTIHHGVRGPQPKRACPEPGCTGRYASQSKLKLCPKHSAVIYAARAKVERAKNRKVKP